MRTGRIDDEGRLVEILEPRDQLVGRFHPDFIDALADLPEHVHLGWHLVDGAWVETLPAPPPTADDVRAEASRRMQALVGARDAAHLEILIANGTREAVRLLRIQATRLWTTEEAERAAQLEQLDAAIEAIRAASNAMEGNPPADYADDAHWPTF